MRNLQSAGGSLREDIPSLVEATVLNALRRWFAVLFWFLLLGPAGALGYRLLALMAESPMRARVPVEPLALAQRLLGWIEWPVAQLMAFSMALVGNFDTAWKAWRRAHGERLTGNTGFLGCGGAGQRQRRTARGRARLHRGGAVAGVAAVAGPA